MKKYSTYKPSNLKWIENIPSDWKIKRLKDFGLLQNGVSKGKEYFGAGYPFVSYGNIYNDTILIESIDKLANSTKEEQKLYSVKEGDVFFTRTSETINEIGIASTCQKTISNATFSGFTIRFRQDRGLLLKEFSKYFFKAQMNRKFLINEINIVTRASLSQGVLGTLPVLIPDKKTQTEIANYLDTKTKAIDKKIDILLRKISNYKEYRKSLINNIVNKGLDNNVEFKNSEVSYIASIPKHWKIERIKDIFDIGRGRVIGQELLVDNGLYPVYSSQTENNGCLGYINTYDFDNDLLTWTTDGANAGTVFRRSGKFNCTNVCGTLIPKKKNLDLDYLVYALQESAKHNKRIDTNGAKIMNNEMAVIKIPFPPLDEQTKIADFLDKKTQTIDNIVININKQIEALKELRKTLINDVVTGKIKVVDN